MTGLPPTAEIVGALKYAVAPCFGAAAVVYLSAVGLIRLSQRRFAIPICTLSPAIAAFALLCALAVGNYAAGSDRPFPWIPDGKPWHLAWWVIGTMVFVEFLARIPGLGVGVGNLLRGLAAGLAAAFVIPAAAQAEARWWIPAAGLAIAAVWATVDTVARNFPGGSLAYTLALNCGGTAAICLHAESLGFLGVATFLAAGLAACAIGAWLTRSDSSAAASAATGPQIVLLLLTRHLRDSDVPLDCFLTVGLAPLMLAVLLLPGVRRLARMRYGGVVAIALVALPVVVAVLRVTIVAPYSFSLAEDEWK